jgi:hypothetical protein
MKTIKISFINGVFYSSENKLVDGIATYFYYEKLNPDRMITLKLIPIKQPKQVRYCLGTNATKLIFYFKYYSFQSSQGISLPVNLASLSKRLRKL